MGGCGWRLCFGDRGAAPPLCTILDVSTVGAVLLGRSTTFFSPCCRGLPYPVGERMILWELLCNEGVAKGRGYCVRTICNQWLFMDGEEDCQPAEGSTWRCVVDRRGDLQTSGPFESLCGGLHLLCTNPAFKDTQTPGDLVISVTVSGYEFALLWLQIPICLLCSVNF